MTQLEVERADQGELGLRRGGIGRDRLQPGERPGLVAGAHLLERILDRRLEGGGGSGGGAGSGGGRRGALGEGRRRQGGRGEQGQRQGEDRSHSSGAPSRGSKGFPGLGNA